MWTTAKLAMNAIGHPESFDGGVRLLIPGCVSRDCIDSNGIITRLIYLFICYHCFQCIFKPQPQSHGQDRRSRLVPDCIS